MNSSKIVAVVAVAIGLGACSTTVTSQQALSPAMQSATVVKDAVVTIAPDVTDTPAHLADNLRDAVMKDAASHSGGTNPVKLDITVTSYDVVGPAKRLLLGVFAGSDKVTASVNVVDARSGATLAKYTVDRSANHGGLSDALTKSPVQAVADGVVEGLYATKAD